MAKWETQTLHLFDFRRDHFGRTSQFLNNFGTSGQRILKKGRIVGEDFSWGQYHVTLTSWKQCGWLQKSHCRAVIADQMIPFAAYWVHRSR